MSEMRRPGGKLASRPLHFSGLLIVLVQCMAIKLELLTVPSEK